jgi:hypothetical protein
MVKPVQYMLNTKSGGHLINIEPVYEEITGGDLLPTGRYLLTDENAGEGEIILDDQLLEWEWHGAEDLEDENISRIVKFIKEYNEPELALYLD